jgi:hypothetical protein
MTLNRVPFGAVDTTLPLAEGVDRMFTPGRRPSEGAIAAILTTAKNSAGVSVSDQIAHAFVSMSRALLKSEIERWTPIIQKVGVYAE